jgi:hypothetical protein
VAEAVVGPVADVQRAAAVALAPDGREAAQRVIAARCAPAPAERFAQVCAPN